MIKETKVPCGFVFEDAGGHRLSLSGGSLLDVELTWMSLNSPLIVPRCRYNALQGDQLSTRTVI